MFFALLFVIWAWAVSVQSPEGFANVQAIMDGFFGKFVAIGTASALTYHILGGLRHVVMDLGHWEELESGNTRAKAAIIFAYSIFMAWYFITSGSLSYVEWRGLFSGLAMKVFTLAALIAVMIHVRIGLWQVLSDYVKSSSLRAGLQY